MPRKLSAIAPEWWDYTTLDRDLIDEAARLTQHHDGPVIAAGSTGSMPATAKFLHAIAQLPHGVRLNFRVLIFGRGENQLVRLVTFKRNECRRSCSSRQRAAMLKHELQYRERA